MGTNKIQSTHDTEKNRKKKGKETNMLKRKHKLKSKKQIHKSWPKKMKKKLRQQ